MVTILGQLVLPILRILPLSQLGVSNEVIDTYLPVDVGKPLQGGPQFLLSSDALLHGFFFVFRMCFQGA